MNIESWLRWNQLPGETREQALQRLGKQANLTTEDPTEEAPTESQFARPRDDFQGEPDTWDMLNRSKQLLDANVGGMMAGFGSDTARDLGFDDAADWMVRTGNEMYQRNLREADEAAPRPKSREEILAEDPDSLYRFTPEDFPTGHEIVEASLSSASQYPVGLGAAALGYAASGGNPIVASASGIAAGVGWGNAMVASENYTRGKEEPAIRRWLGVDEKVPFHQLDPNKQKIVSDFVAPLSQTRLFTRLKDAGLIEAVSFIPYGNAWARFLTDVVAGSTAEEVDRRMYAENVVDGLVDAGFPREKIPQLREEILSLGPTMRETLLQSFVMEAAFSGPTTLAETAFTKDHRVDPIKTASNEQKRIQLEAEKEAEKVRNKDAESQLKQQKIAAETLIKLRDSAQKQAEAETKGQQEEIKTEGLLMDNLAKLRQVMGAPYDDQLALPEDTTPPTPRQVSTPKDKAVPEGFGSEKERRRKPPKVVTEQPLKQLPLPEKSPRQETTEAQKQMPVDIDALRSESKFGGLLPEPAVQIAAYGEEGRKEIGKRKKPQTVDDAIKLMEEAREGIDPGKAEDIKLGKRQQEMQKLREKAKSRGFVDKETGEPDVRAQSSIDLDTDLDVAEYLGFSRDKKGVEAMRSLYPEGVDVGTISFSKKKKKKKKEAKAEEPVASEPPDVVKQWNQIVTSEPASLNKAQIQAVLKKVTTMMPGFKKNKIIVFDKPQDVIEAFNRGDYGLNIPTNLEKTVNVAYGSEGFIKPTPDSPIYLIRESLRGQTEAEAVQRTLQVLFHEGLGHQGLRKALGGMKSPKYVNFINGFYKKNKKNVDDWVASDPQGQEYSGDSDFEKTEEYITIHFAEFGAKDPSFLEDVTASFQNLANKIGLSKNISFEQAKVLMADVQETYGGTRRSFLTGEPLSPKMRKSSVDTLTEEDEVVSDTTSKKSDVNFSKLTAKERADLDKEYVRFRSFGGGPGKLPSRPPRFTKKYTGEDGYKYASNMIRNYIIDPNVNFPRTLLRDLGEYKNHKLSYIKGVASVLDTPNKGQLEKRSDIADLSKYILENGRKLAKKYGGKETIPASDLKAIEDKWFGTGVSQSKMFRYINQKGTSEGTMGYSFTAGGIWTTMNFKDPADIADVSDKTFSVGYLDVNHPAKRNMAEIPETDIPDFDEKGLTRWAKEALPSKPSKYIDENGQRRYQSSGQIKMNLQDRDKSPSLWKWDWVGAGVNKDSHTIISIEAPHAKLINEDDGVPATSHIYAHRVEFNTPFNLTRDKSDPEKNKEPRGKFKSFGEMVLGRQTSIIEIPRDSKKKKVPVYDVIYITEPGAEVMPMERMKEIMDSTEPDIQHLSRPPISLSDPKRIVARSALSSELNMRKDMIDKMPEGNMRTEAIRALHRMYMLNPVPYKEWEDSPYAKELEKAGPEQFSFSKLFKKGGAHGYSKPTKEELQLAAELLEKGQIFIDPAVFRAMMGPAPNAINIVAPFMRHMRDKVLKGEITDRMLFKAHFMTLTSQGMEANTPWSVFQKTAGVFKMPKDFVTAKKQQTHYANLLDYADKFNNESGRIEAEGGEITPQKLVEWYNKAPLVYVEGLNLNDSVSDLETNMSYTMNDEFEWYTNEEIKDDLSHLPEIDVNNGKPIKTNRIVGLEIGQQFIKDKGVKGLYAPKLKAFADDKEVKIIENKEYIKWKKKNKIKEDVRPRHIGKFNNDGDWVSDAKQRGVYEQGNPPQWLIQVTRADGTKETQPPGAQTPLWFSDPGKNKSPNKETGGLWIPRFYNQDDGKVRAEDALAYAFTTPKGQDLLEFVEGVRKLDSDGFFMWQNQKITDDNFYEFAAKLGRQLTDIRGAMGDDRAAPVIFGKKSAGQLNPTPDYHLRTIHKLVDKLNAEAKKAPAKYKKQYGIETLMSEEGDTEAQRIAKSFARLDFSRSIGNDIKSLVGIAVGKEGFIKHMIGLGDSPTVDAVEMNVLISGSPAKDWKTSPLVTGDIGDPQDFLPGGKGTVVTYDEEAGKRGEYLEVEGHWRKDIVDNMKKITRPNDHNFGKLSKFMRLKDSGQYDGMDIMKARMYEYYTDVIYKKAPTFDKKGKVKDPGEKWDAWKPYDDDMVYHLIHHWMWDRAKGIQLGSKWPKGDPIKGFKTPKKGEIGSVELSFRPGVYQAMVRDHFSLIADKNRADLDVLSYAHEAVNSVEPGDVSDVTYKLPPKGKLSLSRLRAPRGINKQDYAEIWSRNHQFSPADRMKIGPYVPFDSDNNFNILMKGGLGHGLFSSLMQDDIVWAAKGLNVVNKAFRNRDWYDAAFVDVILLHHDTHFGNQQMHEILTAEVNHAIKKGRVTIQDIDDRILWILNNPATANGTDTRPIVDGKPSGAFPTGVYGGKEAITGKGNVEPYSSVRFGKPEIDPKTKKAIQATIEKKPNGRYNLKVQGNGSDFKTALLNSKGGTLWEKYQDYGRKTINKSGQVQDDSTFKVRTRFWQLMLNINPMVDSVKTDYTWYQKLKPMFPTAQVQHIIDQTTDFVDSNGVGAPQGSLVGMFKLDDNFQPSSFSEVEVVDAWTGQKVKKTAGNYDPVDASQAPAGIIAGTAPHEAYDFYYKGHMALTIDGNGMPSEQWTDGNMKQGFIQQVIKKKGIDPRKESTPKKVRSKIPVSHPRAPIAYQLDPATFQNRVLAAQHDPRFTGIGINYSRLSQSAHALGSARATTERLGSNAYTHGVRSKINKWLAPMGTLPELQNYLIGRRSAKGRIHRMEQAGREIYKALKDAKNTKAIYDYLTTKGASANMIAEPGARKAAQKAKTMINTIGKDLVDAGLLGQQAIDVHGDKYLPRLYLKYLLDEEDANMISRGLKPSDLGYLKSRRDISAGVRELILGEVKDPAFLASKAVITPGRDLALLNWLSDVADNPNWVLPSSVVKWDTLGELRKLAKDPSLVQELQLRDTLGKNVTPYWMKQEARRLQETIIPTLKGKKKKLLRKYIERLNLVANEKIGKIIVPSDYEKIPDSRRWGDLAGMVVRKEIYHDLIGGFKSARGDESVAEQVLGDHGALGNFNRFWKWSKVSANPPSWVRNFISNVILMTLGGVPLYRIPGLFISGIREMKKQGENYNLVLDNGLAAGSFSNVELQRIEREFVDLQKRMKRDDKHPLNFIGQIQGAFNWTRDKTGDFYGGIDTLGKVMMTKWARDQGMKDAEAIALAEKWLFDYSLVKPSVRYLSTATLGAPFIRFTSFVAPLMLETMLTRPWRMAPYYALAWGLKEMFKNEEQIGEEELDGLKQSLADYLLEKSYDGIFPANVVPLPWRDDNGKVQFFDLSYLFPWGQFSEIGSELWNGQVVEAMKTLGMMGGPTVNIAAAITTGVDPFTRRKITNDLDTPTEQFADILWYTYNLAMPPMFHTEYGAGTRVYDNLMGNLTKEGEEKFTSAQAWSRMAGLNVTPINPQESRAKKLRYKQSELLKLTRQRNKAIREATKMQKSASELREIRQEYDEKLKRRRDDLSEWIQKTSVTLKEAS